MLGGTNPLRGALGKGMRQIYSLARSGGNGQIGAARTWSDKMKGHGNTSVLGHWWRGAAALSAALVADAAFTDNRTLAFVTLALCAALMIYAAVTVGGVERACP